MQIVRALAVGAALLGLAPARISTAFQFEAAIYDGVKPSVVQVSCSADGRTATGFLWSGSDTAVTALHVVAGCGNISIHYEALKVSRQARVARVLRRADLALLKIANAPNAVALTADPAPPPLSEQLSTLGYPLQVPSMESTSLELRYGGRTLRDIVPESVAKALSGGSPSLDLEIESIEGHLLPGNSGAPVFDRRRRVVAIADGGLENGAAALSWAIPAKFLNQLAASSENADAVQTYAPSSRAASALLFSAEAETKNRGETTCSGLVLTELRSAAFSQLTKSVDDPLGMMQLVQFFGIDPTSFTYDVYQHLGSGATFVLPAGVRLRQAANGDCVASIAPGRIEIHLQLGVLASAMQAQSRSEGFERALVNGNTQGWVADAKWTNAMPIPRFDGLLVRRRAYTHVRMMPTVFQDKYIFEALAVKNNLFIGSAAMYESTPELAQRIAMCRIAPGGNGCAEARTLVMDWAKAVLAIQLTTFPVG